MVILKDVLLGLFVCLKEDIVIVDSVCLVDCELVVSIFVVDVSGVEDFVCVRMDVVNVFNDVFVEVVKVDVVEDVFIGNKLIDLVVGCIIWEGDFVDVVKVVESGLEFLKCVVVVGVDKVVFLVIKMSI